MFAFGTNGVISLSRLAREMTTRLKTVARTKSKSRRDAPSFGFTSSELRTLRALKSPARIQRFLDELPYNLSFTARSPQKVMRDRTASCLEGGIFAAAAQSTALILAWAWGERRK